MKEKLTSALSALEEGEKTYDLSLTFSGVERGSVGGKVFLSDAAARPLFPAL